jgi:hypothetical protein
MDDWLKEWREHVVPLRRRAGFEIVGAWVARDEDTFSWLLAYDGPLLFSSANETYYASPERAAVKPDPARHIADSQTWIMESIDPDLHHAG